MAAAAADAAELGDKAEEQYRKRNAAFSSVAMQILSYCVGETVAKMQRSLDSEVSRQIDMCELLGRLEKTSRKRGADLGFVKKEGGGGAMSQSFF